MTTPALFVALTGVMLSPPPLDTLELGPGTRLEGTITELRDQTLTFANPPLGSLTIPWATVTRLETSLVRTFVFEDLSVRVGTATITESEVRIRTDDGLTVRPRARLLSILPTRPTELDKWRLSADAGTNLNFGNSDQVTYDASTRLVREDAVSRFALAYDGRVGFADDTLNQNRHVGDARLFVFLSKIWFLTPAFATITHDQAQSIRLRLTPGVGGGVHLARSDRLTWELALGLAYQYLERLPGEDGAVEPPNDDLALTPRTSVHWIPFTPVTVDFSWSSNVVLTNPELTHHEGSARVGYPLNSHLNLFTRAVFVRQEQLPNPTDDNPDPVRNDIQLVFGLGLTLGG